MKLVVAGSRHIPVARVLIVLQQLVESRESIEFEEVTEIVEGGCHTGVDKAAKIYFTKHLIKPVTTMLADWTVGKAAGPIRNKEMAEYGDALLLIWDGRSRGSASMKRAMQELNKPIYEIVLKDVKPRATPERVIQAPTLLGASSQDETGWVNPNSSSKKWYK